MKTIPLKVKFKNAAIDTIKKLADDRGITATTVVHQAITNEAYINDKQKSGTRFYAVDSDGTQYEVKF